MKIAYKAFLTISLLIIMLTHGKTTTTESYPTQSIINGDFSVDLNGWTSSVYSYSGSGTWETNVTNGQANLYAYYGNVVQLTQMFPQRMYPLTIEMDYERLLPNTCNSVDLLFMNDSSALMYFRQGGDNWNYYVLHYIDANVEGVQYPLAQNRPDLQSGHLRMEFNYNNNSITFFVSGEYFGYATFSNPNAVFGNGIRLQGNNGCYDGRNEILGIVDNLRFYGMSSLVATQTLTQNQTVTSTTTQNYTEYQTTTQNYTEYQTGSNYTYTETYTETDIQYNTTTALVQQNFTETITEKITDTITTGGPESLGGSFILYSTISSLIVLVYVKFKNKSI